MLEKIQETAAYLKGKMHTSPETAIILGTGLGSLANEITEKYEIKYSDIPNFPISTVEGHSGKLIFGKLGNKDIMAMQGRFHYYEGYSMKEVTFPVHLGNVPDCRKSDGTAGTAADRHGRRRAADRADGRGCGGGHRRGFGDGGQAVRRLEEDGPFAVGPDPVLSGRHAAQAGRRQRRPPRARRYGRAAGNSRKTGDVLYFILY